MGVSIEITKPEQPFVVKVGPFHVSQLRVSIRQGLANERGFIPTIVAVQNRSSHELDSLTIHACWRAADNEPRKNWREYETAVNIKPGEIVKMIGKSTQAMSLDLHQVCGELNGTSYYVFKSNIDSKETLPTRTADISRGGLLRFLGFN